MDVKGKKKGKIYTMSIKGDLTIESSQPLKEALLDVFSKNSTIEVNLDEVTDIDLSCMQILCSALRLLRFGPGEIPAIPISRM